MTLEDRVRVRVEGVWGTRLRRVERVEAGRMRVCIEIREGKFVRMEEVFIGENESVLFE